MNFILTSMAFENGRSIPRRYTAEGQNLSPPLRWTDPPVGTKSLALVVEDPDARGGTVTHWIAFNIPAIWRELGEGVPRQACFPSGMAEGANDRDRVGYDGPAPPAGRPHRYVFRLYALSRSLDLPAGASRGRFLQAARGHILDQVVLTGTYQKGQFEKNLLQ